MGKKIEEGIAAVRKGEYMIGMTLLSEAYSVDKHLAMEGKPADGLSHYGLCVAMVQKKFKPAIELCKRALQEQFYNPEHYANLSRVYDAGGNRKRAIETIEEGLKILPDEPLLVKERKKYGHRARPAVPFLDRQNPINQALGRSRQTKK